MPEITIARGLTVLREGAYNTDAGLSTSHGLRFVGQPTMTPADLYDGSRDDVVHGGGGEIVPTERTGRTYNFTIRTELTGPGAAYTDPVSQWRLYHVLLAAGLSGTVAGGNVTLTPVRPDNAGSFTMGFYSANKFHKLTGCKVSSLVLEATAGERGFCEFTGQGVLATSHPTETALPDITYTAQSGVSVFKNASPSLGSWTPVIDSYRFEIANDIAARRDGGAGQAHAGFILTQRQVNWGFPGEVVSLDTFDPFSTSLSGTTNSLSLTHGSATGQTFAFTLDDASVNPPEDQDESGRLLYNLGGRAHIDSGNDEIQIVAS